MNWYKKSETVRIRDMYTLKPKSVYVARNPTWDQITDMLDRSQFSSLRLLHVGGDTIVWDSTEAIHYQMASALDLSAGSHKDGPELVMNEKYNIILINPPGPFSINVGQFFGKKLKSIGKNEYLIIEDEQQQLNNPTLI